MTEHEPHQESSKTKYPLIGMTAALVLYLATLRPTLLRTLSGSGFTAFFGALLGILGAIPVWILIRTRPSMSESQIVTNLRWRCVASRFLVSAVLISIAVFSYMLVMENRRPLIPVNPNVANSPRYVGGGNSKVETWTAVATVITVPLSIILLWVIYRCPKCGSPLKLTLTFSPGGCVNAECGLSVRRVLESESFNEIYRRRLQWSNGLVKLAMAQFLFTAAVQMTPLGRWVGETWTIILTMVFIIAFGFLQIGRIIFCRCPQCERMITTKWDFDRLFVYRMWYQSPCHAEIAYTMKVGELDG